MKFGIIFEETYNNILSYKKHQHNGIVFYKRQLFFIGHKIGSFNFLLIYSHNMATNDYK